MPEIITLKDYEESADRHSGSLANAAERAVGEERYDEYHTAVYELASDILDGHPWFARSHFGPAAHGAIIEFAAEAGINVAEHRDIAWVGDSEDPEKIIKQLAYMAFEAHVIQDALDRGPRED